MKRAGSILIAAAVMICAVFTGTVTKTEAKSKSDIKIAMPDTRHVVILVQSR